MWKSFSLWLEMRKRLLKRLNILPNTHTQHIHSSECRLFQLAIRIQSQRYTLQILTEWMHSLMEWLPGNEEVLIETWVTLLMSQLEMAKCSSWKTKSNRNRNPTELCAVKTEFPKMAKNQTKQSKTRNQREREKTWILFRLALSWVCVSSAKNMEKWNRP